MLDYKKIQKVLLAVLEGLIYFSFLMPFIFINKSIFPFIVGKVLYFEAVVQIMLAIYLILLAVNFQQFKPKKNLLLHWLIFYAASLLLSALFGADFDRAFWSNFERMTGVFMIFHGIAYAIIVSAVLNTPEKIKRGIQVLLGISLIQVGVVLAQYVKPGVFLYANKGGRVWGTLGNSIYIGSYFLFHIFFALYLAIKEKKQIWQVCYLFIALIESYIIIHSRSSRGADLAFIFAVIFIPLAYSFFSKNKKIRLAALSMLILGAALFAGAFVFRETKFVKKIPAVGNLVNSSLSAGTGRTRVIAWKIAVQAFRDRPVLGWGLENFYYAFNKYYNPESLRYSYYETWFDRSHSVIFDTLSSGGIIGMVSYFGLFAVAAYLLFAAYKKGIADKHAFIFFSVIFCTYLIQILFVFDHPSSYLLLFFSFGLVLSLASGRTEEREPKYALTGASLGAISGAVILVFLIVFFSTSVRTYKAALGIIEAGNVFAGNYERGLERLKSLFEMKTPFIDDMRLSAAKEVIQVNPGILKSNPDFSNVLFFMREEMLKQVETRPLDVYDFIVLGQIDELLANLDPKYFDSAEEFFAKAEALSPRRQQIFYSWARVRVARGNIDGAVDLAKKALDFDQSVPESWWYLGLVYDSQGKDDLAWENMAQAIKRGYAWKSTQEIYFAAALGEKLKKNEDLVVIYLALIEREPSADNYARLGAVYNRLGEKDKAAEAFRKAEQINSGYF